jgi:tetratricopeptide (TPR) repeat protein
MKSEHRHELETNSLASTIVTAPETLRKYSSKILTVIAIALLIVAAVRYKKNQDAAAAMQVRQSLAIAWNAVQQIQHIGQMAFFMEPGQKQTMLEAAETEVKTAVQSVVDVSDTQSDQAQLASAYLALGELYWVLANESELATLTASTQPTTRPTNYLDLSQNAFEKIVSQYPTQSLSVVASRFSLAAIAENRRDWKSAREQYKAIIEADFASPEKKAMAEARIALVDELENPILLLPASQPFVAPQADTGVPGLTELPSLEVGPTVPTTKPATKPTTNP